MSDIAVLIVFISAFWMVFGFAFGYIVGVRNPNESNPKNEK